MRISSIYFIAIMHSNVPGCLVATARISFHVTVDHASRPHAEHAASSKPLTGLNEEASNKKPEDCVCG